MSGWTIYSTALTSVVYSINGGAEKALPICYREDVYKAYSYYPAVSNGWSGTIKNAEFNQGTNTIAFTAVFGDERFAIGSCTVNNTYSGTKPSISDVKVTNVTTDGYTVTCKVTAPNGLSHVSFPTWTNLDGQDDITWDTEDVSGTTAEVGFNVGVGAHGGRHGLYTTHVYVWDKLGYKKGDVSPSNIVVPTAMAGGDVSDYLLVDTAALRGGWLATRQVVSDSWQGRHADAHLASITSQQENDLIYDLVKGRGGIRFGYWIGLSDIDGNGFSWTSDKTVGYTNWAPSEPSDGPNKHYAALMSATGLWENLTTSATSSGYVVDGVSNMGFILEVPRETTTADPLSEPSIIYDADGGGFTAKVKVNPSANVSYVLFPTWTAANQTDIRWDRGMIANGYATYHVSKSIYGHKGPYGIHAHAYDAAGNNLGSISVKQSRTIMLPAAKATFDGHVYYVVDKMGTFDTVEAWANTYRGEADADGMASHLVTIESAEEQRVVAGLVARSVYPFHWIGLGDDDEEGGFVWSTGEKAVYSNWATGEPGGGRAENHVLIATDGTWRDAVNDTNLGPDLPIGYVVEFDPLVAKKPTTNEGLTYTGEEQSGVVPGPGYTLMGDISAVDAGVYTTSASLKDGYTWDDGTTDDVSYTWQIGKATGNSIEASDLTYTYDGCGHGLEAPVVSIEGSTILYSLDGEIWTEDAPTFYHIQILRTAIL